MKRVSLRTLVSTIGLFVALTSATVIPSGVLLVRHQNISQMLTFKARLNADRLAQYIYGHAAMWQYQELRLDEQIQLPTAGREAIHQTIYGSDDKPLLHNGPELDLPVMSRRADIVVNGEVVGHLDVSASLRSTLYWTGAAALLGAMLGFGMYFSVRVFPLRVLDRTLGALHGAQRDLSSQNLRFDAALTNMSQGLLMLDAGARLVLFNARFAEIYGLPHDRVVPGMTMPELMALAFAATGIEEANPGDTLAQQEKAFADPEGGSYVQHLSDGRSIASSFRPMPNGGIVLTFEDITQQLIAEEKIRYLAQYDALTDMPNRASFHDQMGVVMQQLRRGESVGVLSMDLDHFKAVNDTLGHPVGDLLLQAVARRMQSCLRDEDIAARLGGDEFAILQIPAGEPSDTSALATRIIEVVGAPYDLDNHRVMVGVSIGIVIATEDDCDPDSLMKNSDLALYRAKADGGSVYRFFEADMDALMQARRVIELDLRKAISNGDEFELFYQPIVDIKTGKVTSCEALLRWNCPGRGLLMPADFFPVAEATGLIVPIGAWVLQQACFEAAQWPEAITIAVNLSPAQFKSKVLVSTVESALETSGLPGSRLVLEITELVLAEKIEDIFAVLHQLRDLGIRIAMDDFGTGYSSLGYLRSFPFSTIKIDQSFIRDLPGREDSVAIVRAVVGLSSSLGIETIAEGVETEEQLASVTSEGCTRSQGYLFSKPLPYTGVEELLREQAAIAETG